MPSVRRGRHEINVSFDGPGWQGFWEGVYADERWEPETTALMERLLADGGVFVDVGAWIGPLTLLAPRFGATRVVAVEPDPVAYSALCMNVALNGWLSRVLPYNGAIAVSGERRTLRPCQFGEFGDSMSRLDDTPGETTCATLPDMLTAREIDPSTIAFLKIDIEGYETTLLPALAPWLAQHRPPLQVSLHGTGIDRALFSCYPAVIYPDDLNGDIVALP